jgi:hypothetical protein
MPGVLRISGEERDVKRGDIKGEGRRKELKREEKKEKR